MKISSSDLWRMNGRVDRATYTLVGLVGFAVKHNLDRLIAAYGFHRYWGTFNYWIPLKDVVRIGQLGGTDAKFLATLVAIALPFIWVGLAFTVKRLRSAGWPTPAGDSVFRAVCESVFLSAPVRGAGTSSGAATGRPIPQLSAHPLLA